MHHPTDRIAHTTAFVTPVVEHWLEREIAQWVHPMKDRSDDTSHQKRTLLPRSYIFNWICEMVRRRMSADNRWRIIEINSGRMSSGLLRDSWGVTIAF